MRYVTLTLSPEGGAFHPVDALIKEHRELERGELLNIRLLEDDTVIGLYSGVGDVEVLKQELEGHPLVIEHDVFEAEDEVYVYLHMQPGEPVVELLRIVEEYRLMLDTPMEFTDDGIKLTAVGEPGVERDAVEAVPDDVSVRIHSIGEYAPEREGLLAGLTDRQREVLEAAVERGYYSVPREANHEEIARELGCAPSTVSEHLRKIESRIMGGMFTGP